MKRGHVTRKPADKVAVAKRELWHFALSDSLINYDVVGMMLALINKG
jgi:hypothetical protein